ncbi:MAG: TatD family hydrolase [Holosporales bacterium]|jgi:TatD DNase family protein|nr:TatD family hydrolase [Holosporales bacterium]
MKGLVDSHAHLFYEGVYDTLDYKLKFAKLAGVDYILSVGTDSKTMAKNIEIAERFSNVFASVGIHPHHFSDGYDIAELIKLSKHDKVVAIGEVGLDYHYDDATPKSGQITLFRDMLSISKECKLPYIIHSRECFDDIFDIMAEYKLPPSVFHCYTDTRENVSKILDRGHYISFAGVITFKKSDELREIVKYVPADRLLIETDCPYLSPVPYRGKPNEPAFVSIVAECVAQVRGIGVKEVASLTSDNFFRLFQKAASYTAQQQST